MLKAHRREDGSEMETTAGAVGEPNAGAVLRVVMAVPAFGPGGGAPGDVAVSYTHLTLPTNREV